MVQVRVGLLAVQRSTSGTGVVGPLIVQRRSSSGTGHGRPYIDLDRAYDFL